MEATIEGDLNSQERVVQTGDIAKGVAVASQNNNSDSETPEPIIAYQEIED